MEKSGGKSHANQRNTFIPPSCSTIEIVCSFASSYILSAGLATLRTGSLNNFEIFADFIIRFTSTCTLQSQTLKTKIKNF